VAIGPATSPVTALAADQQIPRGSPSPPRAGSVLLRRCRSRPSDPHRRPLLRRVVVTAFSASTLRMQVLWLTVGDGGITFGAGNGTETLNQLLDRFADAGESGIPIRTSRTAG
jgi:hypothetical protein